MRKYAVLFFIWLLFILPAIAEQNFSIEPPSPEEGSRVKLSFFLEGDAFRSPDELSFELTQGLSLVEYKLVPATGGSEVFITLQAMEAGRQGILAVIAKKAGKTTRLEKPVFFDVMGTVRIQGSWEFASPIYQYEPFIVRLNLSWQVPDLVYNLILLELQKRYTAALLGDRRFLVLPDSAFDLPELSVKVPAPEGTQGFSTVLVIASAHAQTKGLPPGAQWVGSSLPTYSVEASGEYTTGEKLILRVSVEGVGIPLGLSGLSVNLTTESGLRALSLVFSNATASIVEGTVVSRLEGRLELVLDTPGLMELDASPIPVFNTRTGALVRVSPLPLQIEVQERYGEPLEKEKLREIALIPSSARWIALRKNYDTDADFLAAAKKLDLMPWSSEYEARIALALSSGDLRYARYELLRAERNFIPGYIQRKYPLLYVGARPIFVLPASWLFALVFAPSLVIALMLFIRGKQRIRRFNPALVSVVAICLLSLVLLGFSAAERAPVYAVVAKSVIRKVPDSEATVLAVCEEGRVVKILQTAEDWVFVQTGTERGWIEREYMSYAFK